MVRFQPGCNLQQGQELHSPTQTPLEETGYSQSPSSSRVKSYSQMITQQGMEFQPD